MTKEEFTRKYADKNVNEMNDDEFRAFKEDCFAMYEATGFLDAFDSPYDDHGEHNGMSFKVLRRANENEADIEAMPLWLIRFENNDEAFCYPEEICKAEHEDGTTEKEMNHWFKGLDSLALSYIFPGLYEEIMESADPVRSGINHFIKEAKSAWERMNSKEKEKIYRQYKDA